MIATSKRCPKFEHEQLQYKWHLIIDELQTTIPAIIEQIGNTPTITEHNEDEKLNDMPVEDSFMDIVDRNKMSTKEKRKLMQQNIYNRYILLKPSYHQIRTVCKQANWSEVHAIQIIDDRIQKLNMEQSILKDNGGLEKILVDYVSTHQPTNIIKIIMD